MGVPARDIIVIGASAGGVEALSAVVRSLPAALPGAIFAVMHMAPRSRSTLTGILGEGSSLPVLAARDGLKIEHGHVYVAPPDHHLLIEPGHMHLSLGPREQHQRPCINVSFRSAAQAYGDRVAGVVLTGHLDDGTAGLWEIKRRGGVAVVQHPEEAIFPSMPLSALREIDVDHTVRLAGMAALLMSLAAGEPKLAETASLPGGTELDPKLTDVTCPECRGTIWESHRGNGVEFRCRVGHAYSPRAMLSEHLIAQERVLWAAIVALEEGASLADRLGPLLEPGLRERLRTEGRQQQEQAHLLRQILSERQTFALD